MTFNQIQIDVNRRLNYADSPATAVTNRLNTFINQRHRYILSLPGIDRLRDDNITFASVNAQATYAIGPAVSRIKTIYDGLTNQRKLTERTVQWLRAADPRNTFTGAPESWIPLSIKQVQTQPAAATAIYVQSTSASDTGTAYVEVVRTGGYRQSLQVAMTGVTGVQLGTISDVIEVDKFYISAAAVGTVTLQTTAVGGTVLATLNIGQDYGRYLWLQLWPIPNAVVTYNMDYTREISDMSQATDEPLLPPDFHYLLSVGARLDEYEKLNDERIAIVQPQWERGISHLRNYVLNNADNIIVPGGSQRVGWSNLGAYYPSGGW